MKVVHVVPAKKAKKSLKVLLKQKERELRGSGTTFIRDAEGRWSHARYPGWINWDESPLGGALVAEVQSRKEGMDWQLTQAFLGYLARHLGSNIESISILFR